jgi:preprotein translocase subunit SecG
MFTFLLVVHGFVALALVVVILVQRSEGGGLGMGGSPSGLMSARGAADLLTRLTTVFASLFVLLSIGLAIYAAGGHSTKIDPTLAVKPPAGAVQQPGAQLPQDGGAFSSGAANVTVPAGNGAVPVQN